MKLKEMLDDVKMHEIDDDMRDLGLGGPDIADNDDAGMEPEFKNTPMIIQVGKVLDSRGNPNPVKTCKTDDGKEMPCSPEQAATIKMLLTTDRVKPAIKREFTLDIAQDELLGKMLSAKSQEEMVNIFKDKYMKDGGNTERRSNYA